MMWKFAQLTTIAVLLASCGPSYHYPVAVPRTSQEWTDPALRARVSDAAEQLAVELAANYPRLNTVACERESAAAAARESEVAPDVPAEGLDPQAPDARAPGDELEAADQSEEPETPAEEEPETPAEEEPETGGANLERLAEGLLEKAREEQVADFPIRCAANLPTPQCMESAALQVATDIARRPAATGGPDDRPELLTLLAADFAHSAGLVAANPDVPPHRAIAQGCSGSPLRGDDRRAVTEWFGATRGLPGIEVAQAGECTLNVYWFHLASKRMESALHTRAIGQVSCGPTQ